MTSSTESLLAKMPFPELARVQGVPDYHKLHRIRVQLYQNLASVFCAWGHGKGHLGAGTSDTLFHALYGQHFITPVRPGPFDTGITNGMTVITKEHHKAIHEELKENYTKYEAVMTIAKAQWKKAVPSKLLSEIWDDYAGINDAKLVDVLQHCFDRDGIISEPMISENITALQQNEFCINAGIGKLIKFMKECQCFADTAGEPSTDKTLIRVATAAVNKHTQFRDDWKGGKPSQQQIARHGSNGRTFG